MTRFRSRKKYHNISNIGRADVEESLRYQASPEFLLDPPGATVHSFRYFAVADILVSVP